MFACTQEGCARTFESGDELVNHLNFGHDAFTDVMVMEVGGQ